MQGGHSMPSLARRWDGVTSPDSQNLEINNNDRILSESGEAASEHEDGYKMNDDDSCLSSTLPPPLMSSIKYVLHTLKVKGECPVNWRVFSGKYRTITRSELVPSNYSYSTVLSMLEYMAECGQCEMMYSQDKVVCVMSKKVSQTMEMIDLSMLDMHWADKGELPVGAVEGESVDQQKVEGVWEGADIPVQVKEIVNMDNIWFCLKDMVEERDKVMEELDHFYVKGDGKRWMVPDSEHCWPGRMMVAPYKSEGFHRVMVKRMLKNDMVSVLFIDFGTLDKVRLKDVRLLHKRFLQLPAQAISTRMWGVKDVVGSEVKAKKRLVELVSEGNLGFGFIGVVMAGRRVGRTDRRRDGTVEKGGKMSLWLVGLDGDTPEGELINEQLVEEGLADWEVKDLSRLVKKKSGKGTKIINRRNELSSADLVLSVFRELDDDVIEEEEIVAEDEEIATNTHIIIIDDSSDDEDILMSKILPSLHV